MIEFTYIARPLIGAVIGYITNDIAIRMLFRPRKAKYIFGMKVPFTPGLIPKEKSRIALSIGEAISKNLMNREIIEKTLLSDDMLSKIGGAFDGFVNTQRRNTATLRAFLLQYVSPDDLAYVCDNVSGDLSRQIHTALSSAQLGSKISSIVVEHVMEKVTSGLKGTLLGMIGADHVLSLLSGPVESLLAKNINEMLANHSEEMVGTMIHDQIVQFIDTPMYRLFEGRDEQVAKAREALLSLYSTIVTEQLPKILEAVNISKIVESRINEMDVEESEKLILEVMRKELNAIVWLGALLGFLMGCVNLLF